MPIQILDAGISLKIIQDTTTRNIMKAHIRELSVVNDTILKFHTSTCLHHILIPFDEVTSPVKADVNLLRDFINDTWLLPPAAAAPPPAPILVDQFNKLVEISNTLVNQLNKSEAMRAILVDQNINMIQTNGIMEQIRIENQLFTEPLRLDVSVPEITYSGYAVPGSLPTMPVWAIRKQTVTPIAIITQWAGGNKNFSNIWNNRTTMFYS